MYQCLTEYIDSKILRVKQEVQITIRQEFQNLAQTLTLPANTVMSTAGGEEANGSRITNHDGQLCELDVVKCEVERLRSLTIPILTMVACKMIHDEKNRSGGPKIWFLPPRVSEQALSFFYPPSEVVMNHSAYLSDVSSLSKIYVPIKDLFKHWYLLCVDVKKRKLICIDPMQQRPRKTIKERQIRQLANFIDWMIHEHLADERLAGKSELDEVVYQLGEFQIYYPQNLPQQDNSLSCKLATTSAPPRVIAIHSGPILGLIFRG
ncbi:hypothetical protein HN51_058560 [Arachis hypogaea]